MFEGATGALVEHVPPGDDRDVLMYLVRLGIPFAEQHCGKRHEFLHHYLVGLLGSMEGEPTFDNLLSELTLAAQRRDCSNGRHEPIERVSRSMEVLIYHDPMHGEQEIVFGTLRNRLTAAKKALKNKLFTASPKP